MRVFILCLAAAVSGLGVVRANAQTNGPVNDSFSTAVTLPSEAGLITIDGTLTGATREPDEPYNTNGVASVWYKWAPSASGYFRVLQLGTVSTWIFGGGPSITDLKLLGRDGEKPWLDAGTTYYLGVFGKLGLPGYNFELKIDTVATRPGNDDIANAVELVEADGQVAVRGTSEGATYEGGEPFNTNALASVWYKFTPNISGRVRFLSERPLPAIWFFAQFGLQPGGNAFSGLVNIAREGQSPFMAVGVTYYIAVYGAREDAGEFEFAMELEPPPDQPRPANDDFANAIELQDRDGYLIVSGTTLGATFERNEPYYGAGAIWYKWTPSGRILGSTLLAGNGGPRIFSGTALENLTLVQGWSQVIPGQQYYLGMPGGGPPYDFETAIQVESPSGSQARPYNDDFSRAFELRQPSGNFFIWLDGATLEPGEPATVLSCPGQERSIWHKFTAPVDGVFQIKTKNILPDPRWVELFTGDSLARLAPIGPEMTDTGEQFSLSGGQTYYIRAVGCVGYGIQLSYTFVPGASDGAGTAPSRLAQSITMPAIQDVIFGAPPITLQATANSGLSVSFSVVSGPVAVSGTLLKILGGGFVTIAADQPGNDIYEAAPEVRQTFRVRPAPQFLTFDPVDTTLMPIRLHASSSSGLPVHFEVVSGSATISENTITESTEGPLTIQAVQPGNDDYEAARPVTQSFVAKRISQIVEIEPVEDIRLIGGSTNVSGGGTNLSGGMLSALALNTNDTSTGAITVSLSASASSGLPVSFLVVSGPGQIAGRTLTVTAPGDIVLEAVQSGDKVFSPASAQRTIKVLPEDSPRIAISGTGGQPILTWSASYIGFKLESATDVAGPWVEINPVFDPEADHFSYTAEASEPQRFFRLSSGP